MNIEIERKFLLKNSNWRSKADNGIEIKQGYLNSTEELTTRIRTKGLKGFITIKGKTKGISRAEFEYEIPFKDALNLLDLCKKPIIEKTRFIVKIKQHDWEIDVFEGENKGLIVAEIELSSEEESFERPDWIGKEVSHENKYFNSCLVRNPYTNWK